MTPSRPRLEACRAGDGFYMVLASAIYYCIITTEPNELRAHPEYLHAANPPRWFRHAHGKGVLRAMRPLTVSQRDARSDSVIPDPHSYWATTVPGVVRSLDRRIALPFRRMPKLSDGTIEALNPYVTGDLGRTRQRDAARLVALFNAHGCQDEYSPGLNFPKRRLFAEERLCKMNGTPRLQSVIEDVFDPANCIGPPTRVHKEINRHLTRDGFRLVQVDGRAKLQSLTGPDVAFIPPTAAASSEFVMEHVRKCKTKLRDGDLGGAITNARSLCEDVLCEIERRLNPAAGKYDGDLPKLYKAVSRLLSMETDKERDDVAQLLRGLASTVSGLAGMSNDLGDRHGGSTVRPKPEHAKLAVNAAYTFCSFILARFAEAQCANTGRSRM